MKKNLIIAAILSVISVPASAVADADAHYSSLSIGSNNVPVPTESGVFTSNTVVPGTVVNEQRRLNFVADVGSIWAVATNHQARLAVGGELEMLVINGSSYLIPFSVLHFSTPSLASNSTWMSLKAGYAPGTDVVVGASISTELSYTQNFMPIELKMGFESMAGEVGGSRFLVNAGVQTRF